MDPYLPSTGAFDGQKSLNDKDVADLKRWGMNFVRLGVMWEAVERSPEIYDEEYIQRVEDLIYKLGEAGIYTLVDAHQDVFARVMCGEGIPDFYAKQVIGKKPSCISPMADMLLEDLYEKMGVCKDMRSFGYRVDENGDFEIEDCLKEIFARYYYTKQGQSAFEALYTNRQSLQDKFIAYWDFVSARFAGNPFVVGFDPINEPPALNNVKDPSLRKPGVMD